jgi:hypothetical protein
MGAAGSTQEVFAATEESKRALAAKHGEILSATITRTEYVPPGAGEMRGNTDFLIEVKAERGEPTVVVRYIYAATHICLWLYNAAFRPLLQK